MGQAITLDAAVRMKGEMHGFMRGELQDHEGKSEFENHLQGHEAEQRVVVALLDRSKETDDQQNRASAPEDLEDAGHYGVGDGAVQAGTPPQASQPAATCGIALLAICIYDRFYHVPYANAAHCSPRPITPPPPL
jgi:hypothetical protein